MLNIKIEHFEKKVCTVGQETDLYAQKYYRNIEEQIWDDIGHTHFL